VGTAAQGVGGRGAFCARCRRRARTLVQRGQHVIGRLGLIRAGVAHLQFGQRFPIAVHVPQPAHGHGLQDMVLGTEIIAGLLLDHLVAGVHYGDEGVLAVLLVGGPVGLLLLTLALFIGLQHVGVSHQSGELRGGPALHDDVRIGL